jgi:GDP-4-dehydro-6-deoxy-D-mannose reductase
VTHVSDTTARDASLVTGALGFVGTHLVRSLLLAGVPVVGVGRHLPDDPPPRDVAGFRCTGPAPELPGALCYEGAAGRFWYLPLALEEQAPIAGLLDRLRPATIYHLAAQSSARVSFDQPRDTFASNVMGTLNLLEAVRAQPAGLRPVMLNVGSCEEYGPQAGSPAPLTEHATLHPLSPYAVSKVAQTLLCRQYARSWDLPVIMVRSFSHSGPGQDARFAFPSFARQIARAEAGLAPPEIATGDLSAVRDFLDVRDVVVAYRRLVQLGSPGEVYNVCSGVPLTIAAGLDILLEGARRPLTTTVDPDRCRPSDTPYLVGDAAKLRDETGWVPEHDFANTLGELLEAARKELA